MCKLPFRSCCKDLRYGVFSLFLTVTTTVLLAFADYGPQRSDTNTAKRARGGTHKLTGKLKANTTGGTDECKRRHCTIRLGGGWCGCYYAVVLCSLIADC